jgi:hypothetical protein
VRTDYARVEGSIAFVPLTQGFRAIVDAADVALVGRVRWQAWRAQSGLVYAARKFTLPGGGRRTCRMHRFILAEPDGFEVDHINGDCLDNRRSNLRVVTRHENMRNRHSHREGIGGVTLDKRSGVVHGAPCGRLVPQQTGCRGGLTRRQRCFAQNKKPRRLSAGAESREEETPKEGSAEAGRRGLHTRDRGEKRARREAYPRER